MKFKPTLLRRRSADRRGFTLVEVLVALVLMGVVVPVALQAIRLSSRMGQVAARKIEAARVAENVLNDYLATLNSFSSGGQRGTLVEGARSYDWSITSESWTLDNMRLVTARVAYVVQGDEFDVALSTLVDPNVEAETATQ